MNAGNSIKDCAKEAKGCGTGWVNSVLCLTLTIIHIFLSTVDEEVNGLKNFGTNLI